MRIKIVRILVHILVHILVCILVRVFSKLVISVDTNTANIYLVSS